MFRFRLGRRVACVAFVVLVSLIAATCVRSSSERCADGSTCPAGMRCFRAADETRCVLQGVLDACDGLADGAACELAGETGACIGGGCVISRCGDGVVDAPEVCDDGNTAARDGCSSDCRSDEQCGNAYVDLALGEQCDDGTGELAGDGCTPQCLSEYRLWREVTPDGPGPRVGHGYVTDPLEGVMMFGGGSGALMSLASGSGQSGTNNATWRWTGGTWMPLDPPTSPSKRARFAIAYDPRRDRVVLFGGLDGSARLSDTWEWDGINWTAVAPTNAGPSARSDASMACDGQRCVLFGGSTSTAILGDTWAWDGTSWTRLDAATTDLAPRGRATMVFHEARNRIVLYGGEVEGAQPFVRDTWELPAGASQWTQTTASAGTPPPAATATRLLTGAYEVHQMQPRVLVVASGEAWSYNTAWTNLNLAVPSTATSLMLARDLTRSVLTLLGSTQATGALENRDWTGLGWSGTWMNSRPAAGARAVAAAYDERRARAVILDANTFGTYEWDGAAWRLFRGFASHPTKLYGTALAYDARCGVMVAFGGAQNSSQPAGNETWIYDGASWVSSGGAAPPARLGHSMIYDPGVDAILMFGGRTAAGTADDLWAWTGPDCASRTWTPIAKAGTWPGPRAESALVFDRERGAAVMFGGEPAPAAGFLDDTWELRATRPTPSELAVSWTAIASTTSPAARAGHDMALDPRRRRVVLFGGTTVDGATSDTWELDDSTWSQVPTVISPNRRTGMAMTQDATGSVISVSGSNNGGTALGELLRLRFENSLALPERCEQDIDTDGDELAGCADPDCQWRCTPWCPEGTSCPRCGDTTCDRERENYLICPSDCP